MQVPDQVLYGVLMNVAPASVKMTFILAEADRRDSTNGASTSVMNDSTFETVSVLTT